jgi:hypothetical protein
MYQEYLVVFANSPNPDEEGVLSGSFFTYFVAKSVSLPPLD